MNKTIFVTMSSGTYECANYPTVLHVVRILLAKGERIVSIRSRFV